MALHFGCATAVRESTEAKNVFLSPAIGTLPQRLETLLESLPPGSDEFKYELDELSLAFGLRLPEQAQTMTFWHRGELGRTLRRAGFSVRVEYGRVIFLRRSATSTLRSPAG